MIDKTTAEEIVASYRSRGAKAKLDLIQLMQYEGLTELVYRVHTPGFNDGDPCLFTVDFIGKPNCLYDDYYAYVKDGELKTIYDEDEEDDEVDDIPNNHLEILKLGYPHQQGEEAIKNYYKLQRSLQPEYSLEGFDDALYCIAEFLLETNTEGVIKLNGDDLEIIANDYYCGY